MPLHTDHTTPPQITEPHFLVFFSSGSPPWCPDCVDAQPAVEEVFVHQSITNGNQAYLILVGERAV